MQADGSVLVRINAAKALGNIGDKRAVDALKEATKDSDKDVVLNAKYALNQLSLR